MALEKIEHIEGKGVYVQGNDIDTDRIIPARFMKCVTFDGLGEFLFYDVRKDDQGNDKEHPLNESRFSEASILISNANFGCGSSREHAPQALYRYGFRAIIAESSDNTAVAAASEALAQQNDSYRRTKRQRSKAGCDGWGRD